MVVKKVLSVVVGELLSGFDGALRLDMDLLLILVYFGVAVGTAGVIDVPSDVFATNTVDIEVFLNREEVRAAAAVCLFFVEAFARVLDDMLFLLSRGERIESEAGTRFFNNDAEFLLLLLSIFQGIFFHCVCVTGNNGEGKHCTGYDATMSAHIISA